MSFEQRPTENNGQDGRHFQEGRKSKVKLYFIIDIKHRAF